MFGSVPHAVRLISAASNWQIGLPETKRITCHRWKRSRATDLGLDLLDNHLDAVHGRAQDLAQRPHCDLFVVCRCTRCSEKVMRLANGVKKIMVTEGVVQHHDREQMTVTLSESASS
eukprot:1163062-Rhodomonas_salina.2